MQKDHHENDAMPEPNECEALEQFPVDAFVTKVGFDLGALGELIRIVVMNDQNTQTYSARKEYHHNNTALSIEGVQSFTMRCGTLPGTDEAIASFVNSMPPQFNTNQAPSWHLGVKPGAAPRSRLYKAADPDDATRMIGVLVEQDDKGCVTQLTWYKTRDAKALFRRTPPTLDFHLVTTGTGAPSTDPNDIGGWTWYYTTSLG